MLRVTDKDVSRTRWLASLKNGDKVNRHIVYYNGNESVRAIHMDFPCIVLCISGDERFIVCDVDVDDTPIVMMFRRDTGQHVYGSAYGRLEPIDKV